jgi:sec-independent protein translocase protein TatA
MDLFAPRHLLIILVVCLVVFGTRKLKTLGSDLGSAVKGFKQAMREGESEEPATAASAPAPTQRSAPELTAAGHGASAQASSEQAVARNVG